MVAKGASNQQIARHLVISINTVKVHMRNIFEKLEVQSRTEASLRAIQEGWVTITDDGKTGSAEKTIPSAKTFLLTDSPALILQPWQQFFLLGAIVLSLATMVAPLVFNRPAIIEAPYIPVVISSNTKLYESPAPTPDPKAKPITSQWTSRNPMTINRAGLGAVAFNGKIYAIGGVKSSDKATRFVEIYDPTSDSWADGATKPTAVANISAGVMGDKIYVPGGCTNDRDAVDILEVYHPASDTWETGASMPGARCGYGLAATNNRLYLFGGWDGQGFSDTILVYAPETERWEVLDAVLPEPRGYMGVAVLNNLIYVVGGFDGRTEFAETYLFNPVSETWSEKAALNEPRGGLGLATVSNQLYAIGGGWTRPVESSEVYDPETDTWTKFETPSDYRWRNLGLTTIGSDIYAVGGWNDTRKEYLGDITSYNVVFQLFLPNLNSRNN